MRNIAIFLFAGLVLIIFRAWFMPGLLSTFDLVYYSKVMMKDASLLPYAWGWHHGFDGFARFVSPFSWISPLINIPQVLLGNSRLSWAFIERFIYLYPALILAIVSPILLFKRIFPDNKFYLLSALIFSLNSYALLLFGGEVFLSIAYAIAPFTLLLFINLLKEKKYDRDSYIVSILLGLAVSLQMMADPRITYVTIFILFSYFIFHLLTNLKGNRNVFLQTLLIPATFLFIIPATVLISLHAFWIIPSVLYGGNPIEKLGAAFSTTDAVNYLSFAKFENTISLLQPNWPENIFGKVYFMKPEFILIPILAFVSLFFVKNLKDQKVKSYIIFFALLGLLGSFLAKGSNEPFGSVYLWLFDHFPGFIMFRDSTKWYLLVAVSYSILIPFTVFKIYEVLKLKTGNLKLKITKYSPQMFIILILFYLVFLIWPAIIGELGGTYKITNVPSDYERLEKFLYSQKDFFRTLWFPTNQRFGYYSNLHPKMSANSLFNSTDYANVLENTRKNKNLLKESSIKYIVVPFDSEGEIFLTDRMYDERKYLKAIKDISQINQLKKINCCGKLAVFELPDYKDHFWSISGKLGIKYQFVNPTKYKVQITNAKKGDMLVFSEMYDPRWVAKSLEFTIQSSKYNNLYNSFQLPQSGNYALDIGYAPQDWVKLGSVVSVFSLFAILACLGFLYKRK